MEEHQQIGVNLQMGRADDNVKVVGVLADAEGMLSWQGMGEIEQDLTADVLELRLDTLGEEESLLAKFWDKNKKPVILTSRHPSEGGGAPLEVEKRLSQYEGCMSRAQFIDIEIQTAEEMKELMKNARGKGVKTIGSFHDFTKTPAQADLEVILARGESLGFDFLKVACRLEGIGDLQVLMELLKVKRAVPLAVMGMGELGRVSRVTLAGCGSVFNYGYIGRSNAPGQIGARDLKEVLTKVKG
jgi:3-dehydroquinate dehydratase-1